MCVIYGDCLSGVFKNFNMLFYILFLKFTNLILKYEKNTGKPITGVTDDEWSGTLEMLLRLDVDSYSYDDIIDNLWSFKTRNRGKENEYVHFSTFSIRLSCLRKHFQELSAYSDDKTVRRYNFYNKLYSVVNLL
jgi:hypothetical protein